ncbi:MAG: hypothetical protein E6I60_16335 [Chloroflexi bacterium]|nr:MAG: hypothetical protein E6I60_16335 [Chloroflexota bacterium]
MGELRQHFVWRRTLAIDETIRQPLDPLADGLKYEGDHGGRRNGQRQVGLTSGTNEGADANHDPDVDRRDEGGECAIDQRSVENDVDFVEPVAQDGHHHRRRDAKREAEKKERSKAPAHP